MNVLSNIQSNKANRADDMQDLSCYVMFELQLIYLKQITEQNRSGQGQNITLTESNSL